MKDIVVKKDKFRKEHSTKEVPEIRFAYPLRRRDLPQVSEVSIGQSVPTFGFATAIY